MTPTRVLGLLFILALTQVSDIRADVNPESFPSELRALQWREVGPYRGGRSAAVAGIPGLPDTYYFGATGGGVWKTQNGGKSWANVSDGYFGGSIGAVAVSQWDPNVVYVGGGEKTVRGNVSHGDGIWKSTDAGETWQHMGLEDSRRIPRIRIHPKNPDLAYAAVLGHLYGPNQQRGVYRTRDGGQTWDRVLFVSDEVGAVELEMDPTNPRILYASFWRVKRTPYSLESGGEGSGLYKSTDGGDTWNLLSENEGFPSAALGIIGITVSPSNNQNLYAMVEAADGGVYRSTDGGKHWARVNQQRDLRQRAWYYTRIYADPADEESVYVLNVRFHRSKDGGKTFEEIPTPHGDNHDLWIDPADPERMIEANDGGANVSYDGGRTWSAQNNQPTAQFYRVSTDNAFPYRLLGGQQDNSAVRVRSRSAFGGAIGLRDWEPTAGGESGHIVAKPDDPDVVIGGSYGGYLQLFNHRTGERRAIDVWPENPMGWGAADLRYRFQWNFPLAFSHHNPDVLFAAANQLFRSDDLGQTWSAISADLTRNDATRMLPSGGPITKDNTSVEYYGTIFALAESTHESGVLWAGTDDGLVHVTRDDGQTWTDVTPRGLPDWAQINSMEVDPDNPAGAYVAATRYKSDDFRPYLYHTKDWGRSWRKITNGIPDNHFTRVLRADPDRSGLIYAGTENGVYFSVDAGQQWQALQLNLPQVPITDLAVKRGNLIAATQGRGFWILDDLSVLHQLSAGEDEVRLYQPGDTIRLVSGNRVSAQPHAGTNPAPGVAIYYTLPDDLAEDASVELRVYASDAPEQPIWTWTRQPAAKDDSEEKPADGQPRTDVLTADAGLNRFVWDLRYPGMARFDGLILWNDMKEGPLAVPGRYEARLTVADDTQAATFEVLPDPRAQATEQDYEAQFDFVLSSRDMLSRIHREVGAVRSLRKQLKALQDRLDETDSAEMAALNASVDALLEEMTQAEQALYQTKNESRQDPLNFPIRLNDKLAGVMRLVAAGAARPTSQAQAVKDELFAAAQAQLDVLTQLWESRVPALNEQIRSAGLDLIAVPAG